MRDLVYKQWISVIDERTTEICLNTAGQVRKLNLLFDTPNGQFEAPPAHINCRATVMPYLAGMVNKQQQLAKAELASRTARHAPPPKPRVTRKKALPAQRRVRPAKPAAGRPGMGDVALTPGRVAEMRHGSGDRYLVKNRDGSYRFTAGRQRLHDKIVEDTLAGKTGVAKPTYDMLGGGGGAGKTTLIDSGAVRSLGGKNVAVINVDEVRALLPEYVRMTNVGSKTAAAFTHEESSYIAARIQAAAFQRRLNVMLDGTGNGAVAKLQGKMRAARSAGYSVRGTYVTVPTDLAVARAEARGLATGRYVPEDVLRTVHRDVSHTYREAYRSFDSSQVWDMSGDAPKLVATWDGHALTIVDRKGWKAFLRKGDE